MYNLKNGSIFVFYYWVANKQIGRTIKNLPLFSKQLNGTKYQLME